MILILRYSSGDIFVIPVPSHNLIARIVYSRRVSLIALFTIFSLYVFRQNTRILKSEYLPTFCVLIELYGFK